MSLQFALREHESDSCDPGYYPNITFTKTGGASKLRIDSSAANVDQGDGYAFIVIDRTWLNGKYIRWNWNGYSSSGSSRLYAAVYIYDGAYDRTSGTDFPSRTILLSKGNGKLQTLIEKTLIGSFAAETQDILVNVSGGSQTYCTLFFKVRDTWIDSTYYIDIDWVEINTSSGGSGNLYSEHFTDSVTMESTGSYGDYGYISTGSIDYGDGSTISIGYFKF